MHKIKQPIPDILKIRINSMLLYNFPRVPPPPPHQDTPRKEVRPKLRTEHLPNTRLQRYHYSNLLGNSHLTP
jgi:hypothetical protein